MPISADIPDRSIKSSGHLNNPLSQATIAELWGELRNRFSASIFVFTAPAKTGDGHGFGFFCGGLQTHALGLLDTAAAALKRDLIGDVEYDDEDDDEG